MQATIKDVAKLAGVSISTVSRVINNSKPVSQEIKQKVIEAIDELGYKPNEVARTLVTKRSHLIGVIVTDIGNSYVAEMVRGIEEVGKMYSYDILLCSSHGDLEEEQRFIQLLKRKQVEGIILISEIVNNDIVCILDELQIPFVYLNRYFYIDDFPTVAIDNYEASYEMTNYLIELGHKNIAYVTVDEGDFSLEEYKIAGYKKAMEEVGDGSEYLCYANGYNIEDGYNIGIEFLKLMDKFKITAAFCSHDEHSIGLMNYFYDNNIRVPEDISVAGFGDIKIASIYRPRLTTVKEPHYDIGAVAIRKIIKELKEEQEETFIKLPFQIVKRESCEKI